MRKNIIVAMASLAFLPAVSFAAAPTLSDVLDASGISVTGHASGSYAYDRVSGDTVTTNATNQFTFDQAELLISKLPAEGFGAAVDIFAGQDVSGGTYNYGPTTPSSVLPIGGGFQHFSGSSNSEINLHQAYVQYATGGLTVIGGKFATLAGYEVASDPLNTNATRSILFSQQAFTLTGVRAGYKFNDMVTAYAGLSNSATGTTTDFNDQKTVELGVALAPVTGLTINVTDYIGNEGGSGNKTNLADLVVAYTVGDLSFALNGDYNTTKLASGSKTTLSGVALYANYQVTKTFRAGIRGELAQIKDSGPSTFKNKANEITLTGDYSAAKNFDVVSDLRFGTVKDDLATPTTTDRQTTFVVKAIYKF